MQPLGKQRRSVSTGSVLDNSTSFGTIREIRDWRIMERRTATTSEVAAVLGLAPATVQKYAREQRIPFGVTPGGHRRFDIKEVRAALDAPNNRVESVSQA